MWQDKRSIHWAVPTRLKISQLDFFFPDLFSTTSQTFPEVSDLCARGFVYREMYSNPRGLKQYHQLLLIQLFYIPFSGKKSLPKLIADILLISMPRQDTNFHWYIEKGYYCYRKYEKTRIYTFDGHLQWRIQDFPEGGPPTPEVGMLTYHFANFLPETAWKWKNLDSKGGACPWQSPHLPAICQCSDLRLDHMVRFFLFVTAIYLHAILSNGTDCMWVYGSVHMVWFALRAMHFCVCNVTHEWVPYSFCAIAMCDSNICIANRIQDPSNCVDNFIKSHVNKSQSQTKKTHRVHGPLNNYFFARQKMCFIWPAPFSRESTTL